MCNQNKKQKKNKNCYEMQMLKSFADFFFKRSRTNWSKLVSYTAGKSSKPDSNTAK
jgi:hypothetical protein